MRDWIRAHGPGGVALHYFAFLAAWVLGGVIIGLAIVIVASMASS